MAAVWAESMVGGTSRVIEREISRALVLNLSGKVAVLIALPRITMPLTEPSLLSRGTGAFLAKAVLRFQHSKLPAVCGKAALHSPQSGEGWVVRTSGGLGVEQFSPLRNRL